MDIEKFLTGTEFENLIPKFHEEGISNVEDLRLLHTNGKLIDLCNKITSTSSDSIKLNKLIKSQIQKSWLVAIGVFILIIIILSVGNR